MRYGYVELSLAVMIVLVAAKFSDKFIAACWHFFQVDGRPAAPAARALDTDQRAVESGSPGAVDASNGPLVSVKSYMDTDGVLTWEFTTEKVVDADEHRRLAGLVEYHRLPEGIVPPPSRSIRRSIH